MRRIEAVTGFGSLQYIAEEERRLNAAAAALKAKPGDLVDAVERALTKQKELEAELKQLRAQARKGKAVELVANAANGIVVARVDNVAGNDLRDLATEVRNHGSIRAVVLIGTPDGSSVSLVSVTQKGEGLVASDLIAGAARIVGGGGGKGADIAMAGGRDASKIDEALTDVKRAVAEASV